MSRQMSDRQDAQSIWPSNSTAEQVDAPKPDIEEQALQRKTAVIESDQISQTDQATSAPDKTAEASESTPSELHLADEQPDAESRLEAHSSHDAEIASRIIPEEDQKDGDTTGSSLVTTKPTQQNEEKEQKPSPDVSKKVEPTSLPENEKASNEEASTAASVAQDSKTSEEVSDAHINLSHSKNESLGDMNPSESELYNPPKAPSKAHGDEVAEVARAFGVHSISDTSVKSSYSHPNVSPPQTKTASESQTSTPVKSGIRIGKGPPPTTIASEEKPFDFNRFLEQMRHRSAGPVGEYVRSFIKGFTMKPYRAADQTKLIFDFLDFIALRMRECDVWAHLSALEFENATEAMEKLIMNRLYNFTFSPAIKREGKWSVQTDDLERDRVLKQRIRLFGWISEKHLDIPTGDHSRGFLDFAIQELLKINHYKAPRDKVICILNCCKVIFGLIRHLSTEENADTFVPILIFVVLRANPDHLISNVEYISRFRNPEKLSSESGYYLSSLMGAIAFIETMDYTSLSNISQQDFETNVEAEVQKLSVQAESVETSPDAHQSNHVLEQSSQAMHKGSGTATPLGTDESARVLPISSGAVALAEDTRAFFQRTGKAARAGIEAGFGGSMSALGRLFQENLDGQRTPSSSTPPTVLSGTDTPDSTSSVGASTGLPSSRSRMWGLFGVDEDKSHSQTGRPSGAARPRISSGSSLNFGSWGRSLQTDMDSEPPTPQSEELKQGRFATLEGIHGKSLPPRESPSVVPQRPPPPIRQGSVDPYSMQDEEMESGVRTPSDDGSLIDETSPRRYANKSRFPDVGSYVPDFLSDSQATQRAESQAPRPDQLNDEEARRAAAQIDRAHLDAGVETLRSIFPGVDTNVCLLVLEGCQGNVQAAIDKLLEMS